MCESAAASVVAEFGDLGLPVQAAGLDQDRCRVVGVLDNVRSALNTGTILRAAEGAGLDHVHLCGITPTPDNPKVIKTALGSEFSVAQLWVVEVAATAEPLLTQPPPTPDATVAVVVGNEVTGVDPALIERADRLVHLPMVGTKTSLNVGVAFGIAAYWLLHAR